MKRPLALAILLTFSLLSAATVLAKTYPLTSSESEPAASGKVEVKKDKNGNTSVLIKTEHLARPGKLTPPATAYVVWFQEPGSDPTSQGQLKVEKSLKGGFKTTTRLQNFDVLITAESDPLTKTPSGQIALRAKVQE